MSPKGDRHEIVRGALLNWWRRNLPDEFDLHAEPGWRAGATDYFEPDFLIGPAACNPTSVPPADVALLIEVAHSSLRFDTMAKARSFAALGVREYWVVNAETLKTRVHLAPAAAGYTSVVEVLSGEALAPRFVAPLSVRLAELGID
jgi:Uma2 family endonuclease